MNLRKTLLAIAVRWLGEAMPADKPDSPKKRIGQMALANATAVDDERKYFSLPNLPAGVVPSGQDRQSIAMDSEFMAAGDYFGEYHFVGYPALATLSKVSEYRSPTETLATEMTRKWISLKSTGKENRSQQLHEIEVALDLFKVREKLKQAIEHDGFFGRGMLYIDMGNESLDGAPLIIDKATIKKGSLIGFQPIEPMWTAPAQYNATNPRAANYYKPSAWYVMGAAVHASRFCIMISRPVADMLKPSFNFSGVSMSQLLQKSVENWHRTRDSISELVHTFSISGIKTDMDAMLAGGNGDDLVTRAKLFNQMRDNRGLMLLDRDSEDFFQLNTPLSGLDALQAQAQEQMAAPCHIPLVKLFGITPNGLNASSEGEIKVFYDYIQAMQQTLLTDPLVKILQIVQLHLFGEVYDDITFEFNPLEQMTEEQIAGLQKAAAERAAIYIETGVILNSEERQRLADDPLSGFNGIDPTIVPEPADDDKE